MRASAGDAREDVIGKIRGSYRVKPKQLLTNSRMISRKEHVACGMKLDVVDRCQLWKQKVIEINQGACARNQRQKSVELACHVDVHEHQSVSINQHFVER